ncbi:MAG: GNAT family N-acetyltransferase [Oscillospiraceae bacterium]|jgi:GNAT superfamily N-acetyltransferase|nr:GNAT family N-acetyltransferase [Oscillospiraceae bacterium]
MQPSKLRFVPLNADELRDFFVAAHRETYKRTFGKDIPDEFLAVEFERSRKYAEADPTSSVVAVVDGQPVGICQLEVRNFGTDYGWIHFYYVAPEYRGRGYGRQMIDYSAEYFLHKGLTQIFLRVGAVNGSAEQFYKHCGFVRSPSGDNDSEHMMVYYLDGSTPDAAAIAELYGEPTAYEMSDNSHGASDKRFTMVAEYPVLGKIAVKVARNLFTTPERVCGWAALAEHYNTLGVYAPKFIPTASGELSAVVGNYVVHAEEFSKFVPDGDVDYDASAEARLSALGRIAANRLKPPLPWTSPYAMYDKFDASDDAPELYENGLRLIRRIIECYPEHAERANAIWLNYERRRSEFEPTYRTLPQASFQADMNKSNLLFDNGKFAGLMDFNLAGTDAVLSYAMYECFYYMTETEITRAVTERDTREIDERAARNLGFVAREYKFGATEHSAFNAFYNLAAPFWGAHYETYNTLLRDRDGEFVPHILDFVEWQLNRSDVSDWLP